MAEMNDETVGDFPAYQAEQSSEAPEAVSFDESGVTIAALTHRGRVRKSNEDQFCVVRRTRRGDVLASSLPEDELPSGADYSWLLTVTDGLGGQVSGEVASATAIRTILKVANQLSNWIMRPSEGTREVLAERVDIYVKEIQRAMQQQAAANPALVGMATTMTSAYLYGDNATIINLGDSRSYLVRAGSIHQITQDHTLAQELRDKGAPREAIRPYRNVLTRCFNTAAEPVNVDLFHLDWNPGDQVLLCSDGLTDMVSDHAILDIIETASTTKDAAERLVARALYNGGRDNITVVLIRATTALPKAEF